MKLGLNPKASKDEIKKVFADNYWNEINEEEIDIFLRNCCKKIYANNINFHISSFIIIKNKFKKPKPRPIIKFPRLMIAISNTT